MARSRRRQYQEHENHERWLVSYADFITLLFAFFVVMYSISSINEGKYRVLSDSLVTAFKEPGRSMQAIQSGNLSRISTSEILLGDGFRLRIRTTTSLQPNNSSKKE